MFYLPLSLFKFISLLNFFFFSFSTILLFSLLHHFLIISPSSMFFIPLLHLHLLIYSIYFSIHKYIDLLATLHRPYIDPTSTLHRPHIDPTPENITIAIQYRHKKRCTANCQDHREMKPLLKQKLKDRLQRTRQSAHRRIIYYSWK